MSDKLKVLVIDDDTEAASYLSSIFRSSGCDVQVINKVRNRRWQPRHPVDVIVLDLLMPGMDGIQLIDSIVVDKMDCALILVSSCTERILNAAENFARMSGMRVLGALRKPVWKNQIEDLLEPLHPRARVKPDVEEQEFFRLIDAGNLVVHYAPIVDTQRATVAEIEAIPRVHHPKLGMMSPAGMWDTAEALGASIKIKSDLRSAAIADGARFIREGLRPTIGVEVPSVELQKPEFTQQFLDECQRSGVLPSSICVNVTEADMRQNFIPALGTLTRLAMRGVQLAVDEYGSGSLTGGMLARLPVSEMKLSESLTAATLRDTDARCRALDIVAYSKRHDFRVVAKGVSTREHLGMLMDLGIQFFQGPVFTKIKPHEEMVYWIKNSTRQLAEMGIRSALRGKLREAP